MGDADVDSGAVVVGGDSEKGAKGRKGRGQGEGGNARI